jgi:hypothetical protein
VLYGVAAERGKKVMTDKSERIKIKETEDAVSI